jgi:hypothetical protein
MTSASLIIVGLGLLTTLTLSFFDFHRPYGLSEIRHAVMRERYWLAIAGYASFGLTAYVVLVAAVAALIFAFSDLTTLDERGRPYAVGSVVAVFILSWLSRLPAFSTICGAIRTMLQTVVARYPQSLLTATALIARAQFEANPQAREDLEKELKSYALPTRLVGAALAADNRYLSAAVGHVLLEISSLRSGFVLARSIPKFAGFFEGRSRTLVSIERDHHHLFRRVARALFLFDDLKIPGSSTEEFALELSEFISEECDALKARYQRLLAELVLSALSAEKARRDLLKTFGYTVEVATSLPFWPVAFVFIIYLMLPFVIIGIGAGEKMSAPAAGLIGFAQSWAVAIAVFLAVYPKETDFGRPTLFRLPWRSYLVYGAISYVVGAIFLFASYKVGDVFPIFQLPKEFPARINPLGSSLLAATICVYFTIGQSILIDRRLQAASLHYQEGRLRDGLYFAGPMTMLVVVLQAGFYFISKINGLDYPFGVSEMALMSIIYLFIVFLIGYFVPSTAHAHLEATKIILSGESSTRPMAWTSSGGQSSRASLAAH